MDKYTTREAREAPGWEEIIELHNGRSEEEPLSMPPTVIKLQEQWLELARFHIQRLRREIHQKEQMIANLQAENRMLLLRNAHDQEKKRANLTDANNRDKPPQRQRKVWRY
ncbi:uncharacterized protein C8R40DRAFT_1065025 [Lentinula edodes]|uniref:uncharacterized protein n=1 Tax=Lentinula edodes TaxID=5353 RepID=UPI001E8D5EE3|nr:uncharacterized protein C8R40DRAFT_1065025 [Lentinula edodes]KAH7881332.1 hypothetical protein C8R40DRAFT_1065025 [Lentinula edodes]